MTTKQNIEKVLWSACDSFRGKIDSSRYKDYILSMLFVKYLTDVYNETRDKYVKQYNGDERRIERAMSRERLSWTRLLRLHISTIIETMLRLARRSTLPLLPLKTITAQSFTMCSARLTSTPQ